MASGNKMNSTDTASKSEPATFDYAGFIDGFEEVTYWHFAWYTKIMAKLVFEPSQKIDTHHQCRFGKFVDNITAPPGREADLAEVQHLHVKMHRTADALLASQVGRCEVSRDAFDEFSEVQSLFMAACNNLLRAAMSDACRSDL